MCYNSKSESTPERWYLFLNAAVRTSMVCVPNKETLWLEMDSYTDQVHHHFLASPVFLVLMARMGWTDGSALSGAGRTSAGATAVITGIKSS